MKMTKFLVGSAVFAGLALTSGMASAGVCQTIKDKAAAVYGNLVNDRCLNLNKTPSLTNNPFVYTNPDAGCDLGLNLPGLPGFGLSGGGISACEVAKYITGNTVNAVNQKMQEAASEAVSAVDNVAIDTIGVQASGGINVGDAGKKNYDKVAGPSTGSGVPSLIP